MSVATSTAVAIATAAGAAGAGIGGAAIASHSAGKAAKTQSAAAIRAAEIQAQSEREALAFKQQAAEQDRLQAESAQRGNYDQWRAREGRASSLGSMLGLAPRQIPDYVPIPKAPAATPAPALNTGSTPSVGMTKTFPNGKVGTWDGTGWKAN